MTLEEFRSYFEPQVTGCWRWNRSVNEHGYGRKNLGTKGPWVYAHRLSWILHKGPIEEGLKVLHKCDNPRCVNPDHLFLGTQFENIKDMAAKGRRAKGPAHPQSKLSAEQLDYIRGSRESHGALARKFGVSVRLIAMRRAS